MGPQLQRALVERVGVGAPQQVEPRGVPVGPAGSSSAGRRELAQPAMGQVLGGGGEQRVARLEVVQVRAAREPRALGHPGVVVFA